MDALKRLLALCAKLQKRADETGALKGHAAVAHGHLAAATLSLLTARAEAQASPPPLLTLPWFPLNLLILLLPSDLP